MRGTATNQNRVFLMRSSLFPFRLVVLWWLVGCVFPEWCDAENDTKLYDVMWLVARWGQMRWCDVMWLSCYVNVMWCDVIWCGCDVMLWAVVWCDVMRCDDVVVMQCGCAIWCDDVVNWQVSCCHDTCHRRVTPQLPWLLLSFALPFRAFSF